MSQVLRQIPAPRDPNALINGSTFDDAAVYRITDDVAVVQSLDLFTPVVDDPHQYGRIAAVNALSDLYAMGAEPRFCLSIVCFPRDRLPLEVLEAILAGGIEACEEAGCPILGGHSLVDNEPKFGLSVTGVVHPQRVVTNAGARVGDQLVLTKPIGNGILATAMKRGLLDEALSATVIATMGTLNRDAAAAMVEVGVHAATDVTGYGLLGHLHEMARGSGVAARLECSTIPLFPHVLEHLAENICPGGSKRNLAFVEPSLRRAAHVDPQIPLLLADAQTSGGLLISVPGERCDALLAALERRNVTCRARIGEIVDGSAGSIELV